MRTDTTLLNVMHQIPQIFEVLPPKGQHAFCATCTEARTYLRERVKGIRLESSTDLQMFTQHMWSSLDALNLSNSELNRKGIKLLTAAQLTSLKSLSLATNRIQQREVRLLLKGNWPELASLNLSWTILGPDGMDALCSQTWPNLKFLNLTGIDPSTAVIDNFAGTAFPQLDHLSLAFSCYSHAVLLQLGRAFGSVLSSLDLNNTRVQMAWFFGSSWPKLQKLNLVGCECYSDPLPGWQLADQMPQLRSLHLKSNKIAISAMSCLTFGHCFLLEELDISCIQVTSTSQVHHPTEPQLHEGLANMSVNAWPNLRRLSMQSVQLDAKGMAALVKGNWPQLEHLDLQHNQLDAAACAHLVSAQWPLQCLLLKNNGLDTTAVSELVKADWPEMQRIDMSQNALTAPAIMKLTLAEWPMLKELCLAKNLLYPGTAKRALRRRWPLLQLPDLD